MTVSLDDTRPLAHRFAGAARMPFRKARALVRRQQRNRGKLAGLMPNVGVLSAPFRRLGEA